MICFRLTLWYGSTMGNPSGVVHTTVVICSLRKRVVTPFFFLEADDPSSSMASRTRSPGTDFEIIRAEAVSQVMISFAPWNKSPMHCSTWGAHQNPFIWREGTSLYLLGEVCRSKVTFPKRNITAFLQLPLNLIPRADECDTPYTVVMTVCFTTFRETLPISIVANLLSGFRSRSPFIRFSTILATYVYTSDGRSVVSRLTCRAPRASPPRAA